MQVYAYFNPGYKVLSVTPDKILGWKFPSNFTMPHSGNNWYANEFSATIKTNSIGFRDFERTISKKDNTIRIAILGDSMISARQVDFDKTASRLLEKKLNKELTPKTEKNYEVLNFGIDGFGIGQSFLTYEHYAKKYSPDYIFLFMFDWHIWRTINQNRCSQTGANPKLCLWIRPSFDMPLIQLNSLSKYLNFEEFNNLVLTLKRNIIKGDTSFPFSWKEYQKFILKQKSKITPKSIHLLAQEIKKSTLVLHKPREYNKFVEAQKKLMETEFNGSRIITRKRKFFIADILNRTKNIIFNKHQVSLIEKERNTLLGTYAPENPDDPSSQNPNYPNFKQVIIVNLKILETLNKIIKKENSQLILVDATNHFMHSGELPSALLSHIFKEYMTSLNGDYIPFGDHLNKANRKGIDTEWKFDGHLNIAGNQIFSETLFNFLTKFSVTTIS